MQQLNPSKQFINDFNAAMRYYECTKEEALTERKWLEMNPHRYDEVANSYSIIAGKILSNGCFLKQIKL